MTVQTTTSRADYTGNGATTAFAVPFYFLDNTHVKVLRTQISTGVVTTLALTTDYTMTGAGVAAGGTVTTLVAPTSDQKISILRNVPLTQLIHYVPNDPFPAATHEQALDQLTMEVQQINEGLSRALTFSPNSSGLSAVLPTPIANNVLAFNSTATALTLYDPATLLTVAASSGFALAQFSGTGAQTVFTLASAPGAINNLEIFIHGVRQTPTADYTLNGAIITFTSAPPLGTNNILCRWGQTLGIGVPSDSSVTTAKIVDGSVTSAKLATGVAASNLGFTPVNKAGDTLTGALNNAPQVTLASASTVAIGAASTNSIVISGTTTITAFDTVAAGAVRVVKFSGSLTLTYNATSLILPGAASITTAAGDVAIFESQGSGNWTCISYTKANGSQTVNMPAFSAYANASQTLSNITYTKLQINTKEFDTNSNYDNVTNYRFTPTVAGYYQINGAVVVTSSSTIRVALALIYKNGSNFKQGEYAVTPSTNDATACSGIVSALVYLNGSTDYIELYGWAQVVSGTLTTQALQPSTYFQAFLARSA